MVWVADNRLDDNQTFSVHIYSIYREYTSNTCAWHLKQHSCNVPFFISAKWSLAITTPLQTQFIIQYTIYHALWQVYQSKVTLNWEFTRELVTIKGYNIFSLIVQCIVFIFVECGSSKYHPSRPTSNSIWRLDWIWSFKSLVKFKSRMPYKGISHVLAFSLNFPANCLILYCCFGNFRNQSICIYHL